MKLWHFAPLVLVLAAAVPEEPARLKAAKELVAGIKPDQNEYSYKEPYVHWKGTDGSDGADEYAVHCDCSSFIDALLQHADGITPDDLKRLTGAKHPHARQWYEAVSKAKPDGPLIHVDKLADAKPGDFLVTAYPADEEKVDTGHIMLLAGKPAEHAATEPVIDDTTQWDVPVIDSSKSFHGKTDTRYRADGSHQGGAGQGNLRLYTSADGTVAGYAWSDSTHSVYIPQSKHPFAIGRLDVEKTKAGR